MTFLERRVPSELASMLEIDPPSLSVLILEPFNGRYLEDLQAEAGLSGKHDLAIFREPVANARALVQMLAKNTVTNICLANLSTFGAEQFVALDYKRSALIENRNVLLALNRASTDLFFENAPNLQSSIGAKVYEGVSDGAKLSDAEIGERLATLRAEFPGTDEDLVAAVEAKRIDLKPWVAEWLILIHRGDLIP